MFLRERTAFPSLFLVDETAVMAGGVSGMGMDGLRTLQQEDPWTMALMD